MVEGRPIVFLDFDGVLRPWSGTRDWSPRAMGCLNWLLQESGAVVVVSSTWRNDHTDAEILHHLRAAGFSGEMIGTTPTAWERDSVALIVPGNTRGTEIAMWLDANGGRDRNFVILDDENHLEPFMDRLVQIRDAQGMNREHAEEALEKLRGGAFSG